MHWHSDDKPCVAPVLPAPQQWPGAHLFIAQLLPDTVPCRSVWRMDATGAQRTATAAQLASCAAVASAGEPAHVVGQGR